MTGPPLEFTARQQQIIDGICRGESYKQIGQQIHMSEHTVRCHVVRIVRKLSVVPDLPDLPPRWLILVYFTVQHQRKAS